MILQSHNVLPWRSGRRMAGPDIMVDLLRRLAEGPDAEAFKSLFDTYAPRVKSYMMRQGADAATAEDLAQETLLTVWRKAGLYCAEKGSASSWIFTIARNLRIDRLRREPKWAQLPEGHDEQVSEEQAPDEASLENERSKIIRAALAELPADQQEVVILSYMDGLSHSEIAAKLSLPVGTVKSRMRLAYLKIRAKLED